MKDYVIKFESALTDNLKQLKHELETFTYSPAPLTTFIIRDPKTRKISASQFRDRVVHHALCNIIAPVLEKDFIYDSFANQKEKGTHLAINRFQNFLGKMRGEGGGTNGFVLKADISHYFDTINHDVLFQIIEKKIKDDDVIWLVKRILKNHKTDIPSQGMPLGNLTSQFFANVYLNELDRYVKEQLKAKYYLRYVDDFVILHRDKTVLVEWKDAIDNFLKTNLKISLHSDKTKIFAAAQGTTLLGFRIFDNHKLLKKSNARRIWKRLEILKLRYDNGIITKEEAKSSIQGWLTYAEFSDSYNYRKKVVAKFNELFEIPDQKLS